jgi:hypothetical protein
MQICASDWLTSLVRWVSNRGGRGLPSLRCSARCLCISDGIWSMGWSPSQNSNSLAESRVGAEKDAERWLHNLRSLISRWVIRQSLSTHVSIPPPSFLTPTSTLKLSATRSTVYSPECYSVLRPPTIESPPPPGTLGLKLAASVI